MVESLSSDTDLLLSIGRDTSLPVSKDVIERLSELTLFFRYSAWNETRLVEAYIHHIAVNPVLTVMLYVSR